MSPPGEQHLHAENSGAGQVYQAGRDQHFHYQDGVRQRRRARAGEVVDQCPYPGLAAFGPEQAHWFFGRDRLVAELIVRLDDHARHGRPLIVVAPSGAGKSSLLRAGLIPALDDGALPGSRHWPRLLFTPTAEPMAALVERLEAAIGIEPRPLRDAMAGECGQDLAMVRRALRERIGDEDAGEARMVVIIDQLEELFTMSTDETERRRFVEVISRLAGPGPDGSPPVALVVCGLRSDFYTPCADHPRLRAALQESQVFAGPMSQDELREAIVYPARDVGLEIEPGLVELLLSDLRSAGGDGYEAGRLPLLAHALRTTWQQRHGHMLTVEGYRVTGGIQQAVATTAERIFARLDPAGRQAARTLFLRLVTIGEGIDDTRRRVARTDLLGTATGTGPDAAVVDAFTQGRLFTQDQDTVEITHEALLAAWPRLRAWIDDDRVNLMLLQRLDADAAAWDRGGRDAAYLYTGTRLQTTLDAVAAGAWAHPAGVTGAFLAASQEAAAQLRRAAVHRRRLGRAALAVMVVLALVASTFAGIATRTADRAEAQRRQAVSRLLTARGDEMRTVDPIVSGLLAAAAWQYTPTDEARSGMLAALATPLNTVLNMPSAMLSAAAVSPDGRTVAIGDMAGTVRLWDITGRPNGAPLTGHSSGVYPIVFSPDGTLIASGDGDDEHDGVVLIRDAATGRPLTTPLRGHKGELSGIVFSPDGAVLTTTDSHQIVQRWDTRTWRRLGSPAGPLRKGRDGWTQLSPDGSALAVQLDHNSTAPTFQIWDLDERRPYGPPFPADEVAFSPDGRTITTATNDYEQAGGLIQQWDRATHRRLGKPWRVGAWIDTMAYSPDSGTIAIGGGDGVVRLFDVRTRRSTGTVLRGHHSQIAALAYSPDGKHLVSAAVESNARIWDTTIWAQTHGPAFGADRDADEIAMSADGRLVAVQTFMVRKGGQWEGSVRLLDAAKALPVSDPVTFTLSKPLWGGLGDVALSRDGRFLVIGSPPVTIDEDGSGFRAGPGLRLAVLDLHSRRPVNTSYDLPESISAVAISPDSTVIATAGREITLRSATTLRQLSAPLPLSSEAQAMAFTPDGTAIMVAEGNATGAGSLVRVWRTSDWKQLGTPFAVPAAVTALAVSRDGTYLATGEHGGTLRLWEVRSRHEIAAAPPVGAPEDPENLAFDPAGTVLMVVTDDGTGKRWPLRLPSDPHRAICAAARRSLTQQEWNQFLPPGEPYRATCG
ncbi:nSTAND1 domain-containing NTPase [Nonomuraea rubra]